MFVSMPSFSPRSLSGLVAWYSADDAVFNDAGVTYVTNGDTVQQWNDLSGNGYHLTQANSSQRPTFNSSALVGRYGLTFTAANSHTLFTSSGIVNIGSTQASCFAVFTAPSPAALSGVVSFIGSTNVNDYDNLQSGLFLETFTPSAFNSIVNNINNPGSIGSLVTAVSGVYRFGAIYDSAASTVYVNNATVTTTGAGTATTFSTAGTLCVAASQQSSTRTAFYSGTISEVVVTRTALSAAQRLNLDNYFRAHWDL